MTKIPLSVFIIARDEEDRIPLSIKSVIDFVDEVIVIDSGSNDKTVEVSTKLGAKVVFNEWQGYGPQKVFGESLCKNDWILNIDADEEISKRLKNEIKEIFSTNKIEKTKAFHMPIKLVTRFAKEPGFLAPSNDPIRLYNKKYAGFKDSMVHDSVVVYDNKTNIAKLKNHANHRCFRSYEHAIRKINYYSTMQSIDMFNRKRKISKIRIAIEPIVAFFKGYFLRRYFLLGIDGFIESIIYAFARTIRLAKTREKFLENK